MLLDNAIKEFLLELDIKDSSKDTIRSYTNALKVFEEFMADNDNINNIKAIHIKEFAKFNKDRRLNKKIQNGYIYAIRALYTYFIDEHIVSKYLGFSVKLVNKYKRSL